MIYLSACFLAASCFAFAGLAAHYRRTARAVRKELAICSEMAAWRAVRQAHWKNRYDVLLGKAYLRDARGRMRRAKDVLP